VVVEQKLCGSSGTAGRISSRRPWEYAFYILIIIIIIIKENKEHVFDKHGCPKYTQSRQNNNRQSKQVPELANEICAMWKQKAAQVIPIVISPTAVIPKSLSQSLTRLNLHPQYIYTTAKICNSWHMFNFKRLFKL